jgi:hypothetical protein
VAQSGSLDRLYRTYKDRVEFLVVYIREAHPGSIVSIPTEHGGTQLQVVPQTSSTEERLLNLRRFVAVATVTMPAGIDSDDGVARRAYAAWPDRLYAVGMDGRVAYQGAPGPMGFKVAELEVWLRENVK